MPRHAAVSTLTASYATNTDHRPQDHTGTQIRVAAQGPQSAGVLGVIDQTDLFRLMARALRLPGPVTSSRP